MTAQIAIVGAGEVGAAAAYALLRGSVCSEILLVDKNPDKRDGQARDLSDACACEGSSTRIRAGTHKEAGQCDIVVVTAGSKRTRGMRLFDERYISLLKPGIGVLIRTRRNQASITWKNYCNSP